MKTPTQSFRLSRPAAVLCTAALLCAQVSVDAQDRSEKQRRFEADRQACLSGTTGQVYESCMKEAKAVFAERPGSNPTVSPEQLQRNALQRCEALAGDERTACIARMQGAGTISGSVSGGGVLRELVTTEPVTSAPQRTEPTNTGR